MQNSWTLSFSTIQKSKIKMLKASASTKHLKRNA